MQYIESLEFFSRCAIASGTRTLRNIFEKTPALYTLMEHEDVVAGRIQHLLKVPFDKQYEHPYDIAIAAYLWVLKQNGWDKGRFNVREISGSLFWALKVDMEG